MLSVDRWAQVGRDSSRHLAAHDLCQHLPLAHTFVLTQTLGEPVDWIGRAHRVYLQGVKGRVPGIYFVLVTSLKTASARKRLRKILPRCGPLSGAGQPTGVQTPLLTLDVIAASTKATPLTPSTAFGK